jgi:hypothetical protein
LAALRLGGRLLRAPSNPLRLHVGSIKRVAAAVGEGAQVVAALHSYLATIKSAPHAEVSLNAKSIQSN